MSSKISRLAISDEGFIFDPETGTSFTVNSTGLFILKCLKEGLTEEEILSKVCSEFDVSEEEAKRDLLDFLDQLRIYGLVKGEA